LDVSATQGAKQVSWFSFAPKTFFSDIKRRQAFNKTSIPRSTDRRDCSGGDIAILKIRERTGFYRDAGRSA
jgi:hypothetical protein